MRLLLAFVRIFAPLRVIARELAIIRELWELELAARQPPIYRVTAKPKAKDTEVSYMDVSDTRPKYKRGWDPVAEEDE